MRFDSEAAKVAGSDEWWLDRLTRGLAGRRKRIDALQSWMDGNPPLPFPIENNKARESYERLQRVARLNLAELIVSSTLYRSQVETIQTSVDSSSDGDDVVNGLLLASDATSQFRQAMEWMLALSVSYLHVYQVGSDGAFEGRLIAEHPAEVFAEASPLDPSKNVAAVKVYRDDEGDRDVVVLYRQGYQRTLVKRGRSVITGSSRVGLGQFEWAEVDYETLPTNEVPIYTLENRFGVGEFEKHISHMSRINQTILQQMVIIALQAFKQRAIKGVPHVDPETGEPIDYSDIFTADPGAIWLLPEVANVWESGQADITPILTAVKRDIEMLAVAAQAPLYALSSDAAQQSAESAALMREGQVFKAEDLQKRLTPRFAAAVSQLLLYSGEDERADRKRMRVVWAPARRSSLSERAQAALTASQAGVPFRTMAEKFLELSPAEVAAAEAQRTDDALNGLLNTQSAAVSE